MNETCVENRGKLFIPAFSVGRTQEIVYMLDQLHNEGLLPKIPVFIDSPLAINATEVFINHPECFDDDLYEYMIEDPDPFGFKGLTYIRSGDGSRQLNENSNPCIIIAGSGMMNAGRIKHHLAKNIERPESTILFVGYQAAGTLGRIILDGEKDVRILGEMHRVRARIARISGFSAHADRDELTRWLKSLGNQPECTFVTHGEPEAAAAFSDHLQNDLGWKTTVPSYLDTADLH